MSGSQKKKRKRGREGEESEVWMKSTTLLNLLEITLVEGGAYNNRGRHKKIGFPLLGVHHCDQKQQSTLRTKAPIICRAGSFLHTLTSTSCA